jgi:hypothetical protein
VSPHTRILFPRPSFLEGLGRIFDFAGALNVYNQSRTPAEADYKAMNSDWAAVGADMWAAVEQAGVEFKREQEHQAHGQTP